MDNALVRGSVHPGRKKNNPAGFAGLLAIVRKGAVLSLLA
jgi:hypothetical protein